MLPNRSVWVPPTSGFVPFSPAGAFEDEVLDVPEGRVREPVRTPVARPEPEPALDLRPEPARASTPLRASTWRPATTLAVRRVEMAVLAGVCAYFAFGLVRLFGLL
jgi:hypothetical protein